MKCIYRLLWLLGCKSRRSTCKSWSTRVVMAKAIHFPIKSRPTIFSGWVMPRKKKKARQTTGIGVGLPLTTRTNDDDINHAEGAQHFARTLHGGDRQRLAAVPCLDVVNRSTISSTVR